MSQIRPIGVSGSIPSVNQLALGDIAINTYDGKAYIKKAVGNTQTIVELGSGTGGSSTSASYAATASYAINGGVTQILAGTNVTLSPVGGTGAVTVNATVASSGSGSPNGPLYSLQFNNGGLFSGSGNLTLLNNTDLNLTGSFRVSGSITGSLFGTASWASSASNAFTASYIVTAQTASYVQTAQTASYVLSAISSSYAEQAKNTATINISSFGSPVESYLLMSNVVATTGVGIGGDAELRYNSSTNVLTVPNISATTITGSLLGTASFASTANTASYTLNAISSSFTTTASYALSASYAPDTTFPYTGSARITGSLLVTGSIISTLGFTGSLQGTGSWATNAITASYILNSISSSFASTASYVSNTISSSFALTASYVSNSVSASFASTASYILNAVSSSFATTASFSSNALSASFAPQTPAFPFTGSAGISGSLSVTNNITASIILANTKEYFHLPEALPAQLQDTSRAGDTLQLAGGSGYLKKKEIMMAYDKRGYISVFANYGVPNCTISPYEHHYEYDASNRPVKITNVIGKQEEYILVYDTPGNLKSVERLENGKVIQRIVYEVAPLSK